MHDIIIQKAKRFVKEIWFNFNNDLKYFSSQLAFMRLFETLLSKLPIRKNTKIALAKRKSKIITAYLADNYGELIAKYKSFELVESEAPSNTIWVFWWQGLDNMPTVINKCVASIHQQNTHRDIIVITQYNYLNYLTVPPYMLEKLNSGVMKIAHFSDFVRSFLISNYGGLWMDATLFCTQPVPDEVFEKCIYSGKSSLVETAYISRYRWTTFMLAGKKSNMLFQFLCDFFFTYWQRESVAIDYLFFDHIIDLAYDNLPLIRKQIDDIPINTVHRDDLAVAFYKIYSPESFNEIFKENTWCYKISWRENFPLLTIDNEKTNFNHFINS